MDFGEKHAAIRVDVIDFPADILLPLEKDIHVNVV
jgi:hypothetical protein